MKVFYNMVFQMAGTYEPDNALMESAAHYIGFTKKDIEEVEPHSMTVMFSSSVRPWDMRYHVRLFLMNNPTVHYVDTIYRFEYAMIPDRFVIWKDGSTKEYTGKIHFEEDA